VKIPNILVTEWKAYTGSESSLKGFFKMTLVDFGLVINCREFKREDGAHWIGFPARQWQKRNGQTAWQDEVDYADQEAEDLIHEVVFRQLDRLRSVDKPEPEPIPAEGGLTAPVVTDDDIPF
jgi:hypothetical protein